MHQLDAIGPFTHSPAHTFMVAHTRTGHLRIHSCEEETPVALNSLKSADKHVP